MSNLQRISSLITRTIDNQRDVSKRSTLPCPFHAAVVLDLVEAYLAAYSVAGGDLSTISVGTRLSETLVGMVEWLCDVEFFQSVSFTEDRFESFSNVVERVIAITEQVGEPCYGADASDRFNSFLIQTEEF